MFNLALETALHGPEVRERYLAARANDPDCALAVALHADTVRRLSALGMVEGIWARLVPGADREALFELPRADGVRREGARVELRVDGSWQAFACARPDLVVGLYFLLNPGGLGFTLAEVQRGYEELERAIKNS
jgi:hypothetical protein